MNTDGAVGSVRVAGSGIDGRQGWIVVAAAFGANMVSFGTLFSFGVVLTPLATTFETGTGPVASIFSASVFVYYLSGVIGGRLSDRVGVRPVVAVGALAMSAGLLLTSYASSLLLAAAAYAPLVGIGVGACYSPLLGAVGRWFERLRSLAIGVVLVGVATGTLIGPLVLRASIDQIGWRSSFRWLALVALVLVGLAAMASSEPPRPESQGRPASILETMRIRRFRTLYLSAIVISPGFYAPLAFLNDYAVDRGIGAGSASALIGVSGAFSIVIRLLAGSVGDRVNALWRYRLSYALMTAALAVWLVAGGAYWALVLCALLHGAGWAVWVTSTPTVLAGWFGVAQLGGLLGLFYTGIGIGAPIGPAVSGFIIDRWGYPQAIAVTVATSVMACVLTFGVEPDDTPIGVG